MDKLIKDAGAGLFAALLAAAGTWWAGLLGLVPEFWVGFGVGIVAGLFVGYLWGRHGTLGLAIGAGVASWVLTKIIPALRRKPAASDPPRAPDKPKKTLKDLFK
jgi:hypothetical protein